MRKTKYQLSICRPGWLHKFRPVYFVPQGNVEKCERCGRVRYFDARDKWGYLAWHIRDVLRKGDPMFAREYPNIQD
ncbi:MAG: hypothetical protein KGJ90_02985 [Patescibacteria group bacterium]|nr:hypothetical protein [Patescibacteria group bacterium]